METFGVEMVIWTLMMERENKDGVERNICDSWIGEEISLVEDDNAENKDDCCDFLIERARIPVSKFY